MTLLATLPGEIILEIFNFIDFFSTYAMIRSDPRLSKIHENFELSREWMMAKFIEMIQQNDKSLIVASQRLPVSIYESSRDYLKQHYQRIQRRIMSYGSKIESDEEDHHDTQTNTLTIIYNEKPFHRRFVIFFQYFHVINNFTSSLENSNVVNDDSFLEYLRMFRAMLKLDTILSYSVNIPRALFFIKLMDGANKLLLKYDLKLTKNLDKRHIPKNMFFRKIMDIAKSLNETAQCLEESEQSLTKIPMCTYLVHNEPFPILLFCKYWKFITNSEEYRPLMNSLKYFDKNAYLSRFCNGIANMKTLPNDFISSTEEYNRFFQLIKLLNEFSDKKCSQFASIPVYKETIEEQLGKVLFFKNNAHLKKEIIQFIFDHTFYYSDSPWFWR
ncbi:hypothetical protein FDP41_009769 [Naegleria fowleri]|uniref:F-box domain-containing protein n=1 Tax=Naegleria fowleri TaxID=5763 RepID=A0A6A5AVI7_NAEFO|nr:uncharacterized protein FDP41_009769 [Naegleria fowleri]KAF0972073.1 hypothetical protein FDP41_009769 [Naegleria fowleri]CAG4712690.1 unnamed protein product [Naegleria fowleri]